MLRLISLQIFLYCLAYAKCCDLSELSGNILGCSLGDRKIKIEAAQRDAIATGTVCIVETLGIEHVKCDNTQWIIQREVTDTKYLNRRKRSLAETIVGLINFLLYLFGDRTPSDTTPPVITCTPSEIFVTAKPFAYVAKAYWDEPRAYDETDGEIASNRKSGYPPGHNFREGRTTVSYEAKDRRGNRASCDIFVNVKVVKCTTPKVIHNGYFQCYPVTYHINGATCNFGCYEGFDLHGGPDHVFCKDNGQWSDSHPICKPWKCPDLPPLEGAGMPICTHGSYFRSICSYNCGTGFDMPPKVSKALVCDKTKSWRKFGTPKCIDVEPPTFKPGTCPSIVIAGTDTGKNFTKVTWTPPEVIDNSKNPIRDRRTNYSPGDRLTAGTYFIKYVARDASGNTALNDCSFKVIVRDIRCSKLYPTPYLNIDCPQGYRTGARCKISCDPGKVRVGSKMVVCKRKETDLYGVWSWKNKMQTICKNGKACVALPPPKNGTVVCDNWEGGQFCQVQCKNGTQMPSVSLNKLYICQSQKGEWSSNPSNVKTCRAVRGNNKQHLGLEVHYYFDADCTDLDTQEQIANNIMQSLYQQEAGPNSKKINKGNVQLSCGESSRKKRDTSAGSILILTVKLPVTLLGNETLYDTEARFTKLLHRARDVLTDNITSIFGNASFSVKDFVTKGLQVECPKGSVKSEQSMDCIDCPEGTFYTSGSNGSLCQVCRKGTFQNKTGQLSCVRCPHRTTTHGVGASSVQECEEACGLGSYSSDGLFPCTPCEQGYYQASYGQTFCRACRGSKSTLTFGATSSSDCEDFDIQMISEDESDIHVTLQTNVTMQDFTLAFWYLNTASSNFSLNKYPTIKFSDSENEAKWIWEELRYVKQKNNIENTVNFGLPPDKRWHHISLYKNPNCSISVTVDGMPLPVVDTIIYCTDTLLSSVAITTDNQTSGSISQFNIWHGKHTVGHRYRCFFNDIGDVFPWKVMEEAEIFGAYMDIPSQCDDFNNCVSSPCLHGSCTDVLHGFTCSCDKGYLGTQCEVNIDDCEANICMNNATCVDGVSNYSCSCPSNFTGQYCEIEMVDGEWSEWGYWSECSTTCGDGEKKRKRLCNSPSPDNGGEDCHGEAFDFENCNNTDCPVCPELSAPANGTLDCVNDTYTINCTISCNEGFDFDIEPLPLYYCGPDTFQEWSYQTEENPERRLPRCIEIKVPKEMTVIYSAHYEDLYCTNEDLEDFAKEQIDIRVNEVLSNVACLVKGTCFLNYINIIDCDSKSNGRRRRSMDKTAGFSLQIKVDPTEDNTNDTMQDLQDAFQTIQNAADSGDLTVHVLYDDYILISNSTEVHGDVMCGPGQTKVKFYCVPCGQGSFLSDDICKPCPVGSYQEQEGQTSCVKCPEGKSTIGTHSTNIDDCVVDVLPLEEGLEVTGIIIGCGCALVVITVVFIYRKYKSKRSKHVQISTDISMVSRPQSGQENDGNFVPNYKRFDSASFIYQSNAPQMAQVDNDGIISKTEKECSTSGPSTFESEDGKVK